MRVQLGAGPKPIDGFDNIDCRPVPGATTGHAFDLPYDDGTVDLLFGNAFFEHLYQAHLIPALTEWKRVLAPDGVAVIVGIPDFEVVARCYLEGDRGVIGPRFDMLEVYRYALGCPEADTTVHWPDWSPSERCDDAPPEWIPQLHKCVFDASVVASLLDAAGLPGTVFRYAYIGEEYPLNLAFVAGHRHHDVEAALASVPTINDYVQHDTITYPHAETGAPLVNLAAFFSTYEPPTPGA